jgi:hypothetical protein
MSKETSSSHLLAANDKGWYILVLPDGQIQFDLGIFGLYLSHTDFSCLCRLIEMSLKEQDKVGKIAQISEKQVVYYCGGHQIILLVFNGALLRFRRYEFMQLAHLCRTAHEVIGEVSEQDTIAYSLSPQAFFPTN